MSVLIETSVGDLEVDLYTDECPQESMNFLKLCKCKYYNFSLFHRVVRNFVAQTGDPSGKGEGGSSVWGLIKGEGMRFFHKNDDNKYKHVKFGTLSMVNNGQNMHGSQFFVTLGENLDSLDGHHSVFGEVAEESFDVLRKINAAMCNEENQPYQDIRIRHTIVLDDPFDDPPGLQVPPQSPLPTREQIDAGLIGEDEAINEFEGMAEEEVEEIMKRREARGRAQILEMIGDLPDADIKAPENILFVCKLNPVTTDEDLKLIFSRFGRILSCEIVRDWKSGDSLQYAFIEFEKKECCEEAYLRMENVLIDDRRIHVDFSQSVAKLRDFKAPSGWKMGKPEESKNKDRMELAFKRDGSETRHHAAKPPPPRHDNRDLKREDEGHRHSHHRREERREDRREDRDGKERRDDRRDHSRHRHGTRDRNRGRDYDRDRDSDRHHRHHRRHRRSRSRSRSPRRRH